MPLITLRNRDLTIHHLIEWVAEFSEVTLSPKAFINTLPSLWDMGFSGHTHPPLLKEYYAPSSCHTPLT